MSTRLVLNKTTTHLNIGVQGASANKVSIRVEVNAPDVSLVASEGPHDLGRLQVPDLECPTE